MAATKTTSMNLPNEFSNPFLQGGAAIICWLLAFHLPSKVFMSVPVIEMADIFLTIALKILGGAATATTILSFWFKNEIRLKRYWKKFRRK